MKIEHPANTAGRCQSRISLDSPPRVQNREADCMPCYPVMTVSENGRENSCFFRLPTFCLAWNLRTPFRLLSHVS